MTAPEHSPLPWRYDSLSGTIWDADDKLVLSVSENQRAIANARLIITAVNAHADLLAAAKEGLRLLGVNDMIACAIAKAEEQAP
jgi:hypothetical protein